MDKLPTIKEIAQRLHVSVSTVSRALSDHPRIGLKTKMQVQQLARELNYEPSAKAIFDTPGHRRWKWSVFDATDPVGEPDILQTKSDWKHANSLSYDRSGNFLLSFNLVQSHDHYPQYRAREGKILTLAERVNNCVMRPHNGWPVTSTGLTSP